MTVEEFFEQEVPNEIETQVEAEIAIIDHSMAFGKWLGINYLPVFHSDGLLIWYPNHAGSYEEYTTVQLFHKFADEYEYRRLT